MALKHWRKIGENCYQTVENHSYDLSKYGRGMEWGKGWINTSHIGRVYQVTKLEAGFAVKSLGDFTSKEAAHRKVMSYIRQHAS